METEQLMETEHLMEINSRLGLRKVSREKVIHFPKGLAGLDGLHEYVLLQINPESHMFILQSIQAAEVGLVVANPYSYIPNYKYKLDPAEQKLMRLADTKDLMILVTVSIPHGKPEETVLNLTGPILINPNEKIGLQLMQIDNIRPKQFKLSKLIEPQNTLDKDEAQPKIAKPNDKKIAKSK